jgi:hypothetical protein
MRIPDSSTAKVITACVVQGTVVGTHLPGQADHVVVEMNVMCVPTISTILHFRRIKQRRFAQKLHNDIQDMHKDTFCANPVLCIRIRIRLRWIHT